MLFLGFHLEGFRWEYLYKQNLYQPNLYQPNLYKPNLYKPNLYKPNWIIVFFIVEQNAQIGRCKHIPLADCATFGRRQRLQVRVPLRVLTLVKYYMQNLYQPNLYQPNLCQQNLYQQNLYQQNLYKPNLYKPKCFEKESYKIILLRHIKIKQNDVAVLEEAQTQKPVKSRRSRVA
jgi:uncharacterized protein YjbI with pentapeptide repeats